MHKAYDTILESEVSADSAVKNGSFDQYRYECACCGEEVYIAAANSKRMVPHFKHRNGNNEVECENYLGGYRAINLDPRSRVSNRERVEFFFEKQSKNFSIGLRFSDKEINDYQVQEAVISLWLPSFNQAISSLRINSTYFTPETFTLMPIRKFSTCYLLSINLNGIKRQYDFLSAGSIPAFFRIQCNDIDSKAKLVRGKVLFTNVPYFFFDHSEFTMPRDLSLPEEMDVIETFCFETMGRKFLGKVLTIKAKTENVDALLRSWDYQIEAAETLTLLWPPASQSGDVLKTYSDYAFLYSSFDLQAHGNINISSNNIINIEDGISKVFIKPRTKVFKKNTEIILDKLGHRHIGFERLVVSKSKAKTFVVPNDGLFYLFNRSGVTPLANGQTVSLTQNSEIRQYKFGYLIAQITPLEKKVITGEYLLQDILAHCKRMEAFDKNSFLLCQLTEAASQYIEKCKVTGMINSVAKQFIEEGKL